MKQLKLSAQDTSFVSMLQISEVALNSALEEIEKSIEHKHDLKTKAHFQAARLQIIKLIDSNEKLNDSFILHMTNKMINFCSDKAYKLALWMDKKQGRK